MKTHKTHPMIKPQQPKTNQVGSWPYRSSLGVKVVAFSDEEKAPPLRWFGFVNNLETNSSSPRTADLTPNSVISKSHLHSKPYTQYWPTASISRGWSLKFWSWRPWGLNAVKTMGKFWIWVYVCVWSLFVFFFVFFFFFFRLCCCDMGLCLISICDLLFIYT